MTSFLVKVEFITGIVLFISRLTCALPRPREALRSGPAPRICSFSSDGTIYDVGDLLRCLNQLAANLDVTKSHAGRRSEDFDGYVNGQGYSNPEEAEDYDDDYDSARPRPPYYGYGRPSDPALYQGSAGYPEAPGYYGPQGFPGQPNQYGYSGPETNIYEALSSVARYDDLKCVPRLLCEVATGVQPGGRSARQSSTLEDFGKNALIGLLTAFDVSESSPLLGFAKSALLGYSSRGDSSICYKEYVRCPKNPSELVHYLNNHNGGFFRFFGNVGRSDQGRRVSRRFKEFNAPKVKPAPPPGLSGPESDRTGTGELKFDNPLPLAHQDYEDRIAHIRNRTAKFIFPSDDEELEGQRKGNRASKSLFDDSPGFFPESSKTVKSVRESFFPTDHDAGAFFGGKEDSRLDSSKRLESGDSFANSGKVRLYDADTKDSTTTFTFPDGQRVNINVNFSKLVAHESTRSPRSENTDSNLTPTSFEGYSMVDLADYFSEDQGQTELLLKHPCDMICHDSRGTLIQFNQVSTNDEALSTMMTPERPVLDLSRSIPCEVICLDRRGDRKQISTILSDVLRPTKNRFSTNQLSRGISNSS